MASDFDFSAGIVNSPALDKIQRGERIRDDFPRRRRHDRANEDVKTGDVKTSDKDEAEEHRLDLRA